MDSEVRKFGDNSNNCWSRYYIEGEEKSKKFSRALFREIFRLIPVDGFFNDSFDINLKPKHDFKKWSSGKTRGKRKYATKSNSHSQTKRPEPSDGFLKYLEDEVSVGWSWEWSILGDGHTRTQFLTTWYGATAKGGHWKENSKSQMRKKIFES